MQESWKDAEKVERIMSIANCYEVSQSLVNFMYEYKMVDKLTLNDSQVK